MNKRRYRVNVRVNPDRYRYFATLADASAYCGEVFRRCGVVLCIEEIRP